MEENIVNSKITLGEFGTKFEKVFQNLIMEHNYCTCSETTNNNGTCDGFGNFSCE